mmetsp:Transcript_19980/g.28428  ORF Transcript_19980/g.28428 Transcript_19980/m.28428 type:complete len:404 (-) Transcript_19980:65-1276(-)
MIRCVSSFPKRLVNPTLTALLLLVIRDAVGQQITCMSGAVVKKTASGKQYCDCSAILAKDLLAGKLCQRQATQFCANGGTGTSTLAFCTNGGTCKSLPSNDNQGHPGCDCVNNFWGPHCEYSQDDLVSSSTEATNGPVRKSEKPEGVGVAIFAALAFFIITVAFLVKKRRQAKRNKAEIPEAITVTADLDPDGSSTMQGALLIRKKDMKSTIVSSPQINHEAFDDNDGILGAPTIEQSINRNAFDDNDGVLSTPRQEAFRHSVLTTNNGPADEEVITFVSEDETMNSPPIADGSFVIDSDDGEGAISTEKDEDEEQPGLQPTQKLTFDKDSVNSSALLSPKEGIVSPARGILSSPHSTGSVPAKDSIASPAGSMVASPHASSFSFDESTRNGQPVSPSSDEIV